MANPYKGDAQKSSCSKMHAMTGHRGGGHAHAGGSHFKRAGKHGVIKSEHPSRRKAAGSVHGAGVKPRLDKYASGGRAKGKGDTNVTVVMPHHQAGPGGPPPAPPMPPPHPPMAPGGAPMAAPMGGGMPGGGAMPGGTNPMQALGALAGGTGSNPLAGLSRGMKKGGRASARKTLEKLSDGKQAKIGYSGPPAVMSPVQAEPFSRDEAFGSGIVGDKRGGRTKHAKGGRTMSKNEIGQMDYIPTSVGNVKGGKHIDHWQQYAKNNRPSERPPYTRDKSCMAKGGRTKMTAGAATGIGRLEEAAIVRSNTKRKK